MKNNRTALVTGGAKGIGRATAIKLAACGFNVIVNYNSSESAAKETLKLITDAGGRACIYGCDLKSQSAVKEMLTFCEKEFGFVDTVINNAGVSLVKLLCDSDDDDYDYVFDNNFRTMYNVCRVFGTRMISNQFGRIVNVSSIFGNSGGAMESLYSASKGAVVAFTKALNKEFALNGVIVNSVSPGMIDTDMNKGYSDNDKEVFLEGITLGRMGNASEVADIIETLTRKELYIAGADIAVDGGIY